MYELDKAPNYRLKLANHYLPSAWTGVILAAPALFISPYYEGPWAFHAAMWLAWAAWIYSTYRLETAVRRLEPESDVIPRRSWLISACLGSHPLNYLLIGCALTLTVFKQAAISLLILPAVPIVVIMTFCWYLHIFGNLRQFINERLPAEQAVPKVIEQAIALGLSVPGALQMLCLVFSSNPDWIMRSWMPIGVLLAIGCLGTFRRRLALALAIPNTTAEHDSAGPNEETYLKAASDLLGSSLNRDCLFAQHDRLLPQAQSVVEHGTSG